MSLLARAVAETDVGHATQLTNAASRLMRTYQGGMQTLAKVRTGGSQTVVVQHVHVGDGAKAVIGNIQGGAKESSGRGVHEKDE